MPAQNLPITKTWDIETPVLYCREERTFYPRSRCEVIKVQARDRSASDILHEVAFPVDCLDEDLMVKATPLENLRIITFNDLFSWEVFEANCTRIMARALYILTHVPSVTKITLSVDILNEGIFHALSGQSCLREVTFLLPIAAFPDPNRMTRIAEVLSRGIPQLQRVECFQLPLELVIISPAILLWLGQSPCLYSLEIMAANIPYPGDSFIRCMETLQRAQTPISTFFGSLQFLNIKHNRPKEDLFFKDILIKKFPNIKFVRT